MRILLQMQGHASAAAQRVAPRVIHNREGSICGGFPDVLHGVVVALGRHGDFVCNKEGTVETHTELPDQVRVASLGHGLKEIGGTGLGHGTQVVDQVGLGHTDTRVDDRDGLGIGVVLDFHLQVLRVPEERLVLHAVEPCLFQRICGVGDQLAQEHLLVCVQRVDDDVHETVHLRLELMLLGALCHLGPVVVAEAIHDLVRLLLAMSKAYCSNHGQLPEAPHGPRSPLVRHKLPSRVGAGQTKP
mmetsp:Transcript_75672/g.180826  ORF Transcript_75672/g.180826 Transcript_75672/m.180826 type:complete len:244 (-) Transcript_75672:24-755(-)